MENYYSKEWAETLQNAIECIHAMEPVPFSTLKPSMLEKRAAVYLISERIDDTETALYVGRTKNLQQRLYRNHLMGSTTNARLKNYMIQDPSHSCFEDVVLAKSYIRQNCFVRWIFEEDVRRRGALEGYFTARYFPKYGIAEEH